MSCLSSRSAILLLGLLSAVPAGPGLAAQAGPGWTPVSAAGQTREVWAMGTRFQLRAAGPQADLALEAAVLSVEEVEAVLSTWRPDSPLSELNRGPTGTRLLPDPALAELLQTIEFWARETGRAFDPSIGALIDAWDLRGTGRRPSEADLARAMNASGPDALRIQPETGAITRLRDSAWLDAGGFGKGAGLRVAAERVDRLATEAVLLDLGGQLWVSGSTPTRVQIAHPLHRDQPAYSLEIRRGSIATSGGSERPGHIIDPRTGRPSIWRGSVTVLHTDPIVADILSTALFVMGPVQAQAWLTLHPEIAALILVCQDRTLSHDITPAWSRLISYSQVHTDTCSN